MIGIVQKTPDRPIVTAKRDDGVSLRIKAPDRKFTPPHDLIHFAVENGLRLSHGFWGSVASGAKFDSMEVVEGRQKPKANEVSAQVIKNNRTHLSRAEAIVGAFQNVLHDEVSAHERRLRENFKRIGVSLDDALVSAAWEDLVALRRQWLDLPQAQAFHLEWRIR